MKFKTQFLPAAHIGRQYKVFVEVSGGVAPYQYTTDGEFPPGLTLSSDGLISGVATTSTTRLVPVAVMDSAGDTITERFTISSIERITLDNATIEQEEFVAQLQEAVAKRKTWSVGLASQTSQTLIELISAVGTYELSKITRAYEEAFAETAQTDSAKLAIAKMKGLRIARKSPAVLEVTLSAEEDTVIAPFTQFTAGPMSLFNSEPLQVTTDPKTFLLKEGRVKEVYLLGKGTNHQSFVADEAPFAVSDQDVYVAVGGSLVRRNLSGLWNCRDVLAFTDDTLVDGRLHVHFGADQYGCVPALDEEVIVRYAVTLGAKGNRSQVGANVSVSGHPTVTGKPGSVSNGVRTYNPPRGGLDQPHPDSYALGSYGAVKAGCFANKIQYTTLVNEYPGVVDAVILAQREIDSTDPKLMNILWVSALTSIEWSATQKTAYCQFIMDTVYGPHVQWRDPVAVPIDLVMHVYCSDTTTSTASVEEFVVEQLHSLFAMKRGVIQKPFYVSDVNFKHKHIQRIEVEASNYIPRQFEYCALGKVVVNMHSADLSARGYI